MIGWTPTPEYALYVTWTKFTQEALGRYVPITHISAGRLQHIVADDAPALEIIDGDECRMITLEYDIDLLETTWTAKQ